jgi:hypothetical protein
MADRSQFREFREDGWPLCPACGEDELFGTLITARPGSGPLASPEEIFAGGFKCYACGWESETKSAPPRQPARVRK